MRWYIGQSRTAGCTAFLFLLLTLLSGCGSPASSTAPAASPQPASEVRGSVHDIPLFSDPNREAGGLALGPDGNLWVTETSADANIVNSLARITPDGRITEFPLPSNEGIYNILIPGPDGNLWFSARRNGATVFDAQTALIGRITPDGKIKTFAISRTGIQVEALVVGPDGNFWFTLLTQDFSVGYLGRMTPDGKVTLFSMPAPNVQPFNMAVGPDGNLWFIATRGYGTASPYHSEIGYITPGGQITEFPVFSSQMTLVSLLTGPDNTLWFREIPPQDSTTPARVGHITTDGKIKEYPLPVSLQPDSGITRGSDGNLWLLVLDMNGKTQKGCSIVRLSMAGVVTKEIPLPATYTTPFSLRRASDGTFWGLAITSSKATVIFHLT